MVASGPTLSLGDLEISVKLWREKNVTYKRTCPP